MAVRGCRPGQPGGHARGEVLHEDVRVAPRGALLVGDPGAVGREARIVELDRRRDADRVARAVGLDLLDRLAQRADVEDLRPGLVERGPRAPNPTAPGEPEEASVAGGRIDPA